MHDWIPSRLFLLLIALVFLAMPAAPVVAQDYEALRQSDLSATAIGRADIGLLSGAQRLHSEMDRVSEPAGLQRTSKRQALLIGGLAASIAAYGYFVLEFNNSRGASSEAEKAYAEDVRQNAQSYVDQGIALDEIQSFKDWQNAFDDAKRSREWGARAGFVAIVVGFFAIVDAATSYDGSSAQSAGVVVRPTLGVTPARSDLLVGARVKF